VSKLARRDVTVALSGDGGDELFAGYARYSERLSGAAVLPTPMRSALSAIARRLPHGMYGRGRFLDLGRTARGRYAATVLQPVRLDEGGVASPSIAELLGPFEAALNPAFDTSAYRDPATQYAGVDLLTYLPGDILTKVDRMSMAVSLEARVPLLDNDLVDFAISLPGALKYRDGEGKWILRRAIEGLVPASVLQKPKQGFALPVREWLATSLRPRLDALVERGARIEAYTDREAVMRLRREHLSGRRDHSAVLWRLLVLERWLAGHADGAHALPIRVPGRADMLDPLVDRLS
jgi:asparagine synthase (glutamine-hydrolysing)